jgi:hypothetical protein
MDLFTVNSDSHLTTDGTLIPARSISFPSIKYCVGSEALDRLDVQMAIITSASFLLLEFFGTIRAGLSLKSFNFVDGMGTLQRTMLPLKNFTFEDLVINIVIRTYPVNVSFGTHLHLQNGSFALPRIGESIVRQVLDYRLVLPDRENGMCPLPLAISQEFYLGLDRLQIHA